MCCKLGAPHTFSVAYHGMLGYSSLQLEEVKFREMSNLSKTRI